MRRRPRDHDWLASRSAPTVGDREHRIQTNAAGNPSCIWRWTSGSARGSHRRAIVGPPRHGSVRCSIACDGRRPPAHLVRDIDAAGAAQCHDRGSRSRVRCHREGEDPPLSLVAPPDRRVIQPIELEDRYAGGFREPRSEHRWTSSSRVQCAWLGPRQDDPELQRVVPRVRRLAAHMSSPLDTLSVLTGESRNDASSRSRLSKVTKTPCSKTLRVPR